MKYALESAVFSLSYIERSSDNEEEDFQMAMSYLAQMQNHIDSIQGFSQKVFSFQISLLESNFSFSALFFCCTSWFFQFFLSDIIL